MLSTKKSTELQQAIWNDQDYDAVERLYAENVVVHDPHQPMRGRDAYLDFCKTIHEAFPDLHVDVHQTIRDGSFQASRWTAGGTHRGEMMGVVGTGKSMTITGMSFARFQGDLIVEQWDNTDDLGMMTQLGLIPDDA